MKRYVLATACLCLLVIPQVAHGMEKECRRLFYNKSFVKSAQCYRQLCQKVDANKGLAAVKGVLKDRYLEQAAVAWNQAAAQANSLAQKGWYKEQAIARLRQSLDKQYCKASRRCVRHSAWIARLQREIRYVPVTIATGAPQARITLRGFKYTNAAKQRMQEQLRPGDYTLEIAFPGKPTRRRQLKARPGSKILINVTPVKIQVVERQIVVARKIPPLVLVGYIGGTALLLGGAAMIIYGVARQSELNGILSNPDKNQELTDAAFHEGFDQAQVIAGIGAIVASAGGLLFGAGVLAHVLSPKGRQTPPPTGKSARLGQFGWAAGNGVSHP